MTVWRCACVDVGVWMCGCVDVDVWGVDVGVSVWMWV